MPALRVRQARNGTEAKHLVGDLRPAHVRASFSFFEVPGSVTAAVSSCCMGKQAEGRPLKVNVKRLRGRDSSCFHELQAFCACLTKSNFDSSNCAEQQLALTACAEAGAGNKDKRFQTINHHLQRLSRKMGRK
ncbi:hypothetical protein WJX84_004313 [Apatococcus fuscideae]|uniref:IMS import disulfide relay-system CHCH-CHCH-like Cx9C domain-containing protein n=1 Tax=Apatococcus fuscideae TaxID=2026836 RepID=A0AAW1T109_9CHLO